MQETLKSLIPQGSDLWSDGSDYDTVFLFMFAWKCSYVAICLIECSLQKNPQLSCARLLSPVAEKGDRVSLPRTWSIGLTIKGNPIHSVSSLSPKSFSAFWSRVPFHADSISVIFSRLKANSLWRKSTWWMQFLGFKTISLRGVLHSIWWTLLQMGVVGLVSNLGSLLYCASQSWQCRRAKDHRLWFEFVCDVWIKRPCLRVQASSGQPWGIMIVSWTLHNKRKRCRFSVWYWQFISLGGLICLFHLDSDDSFS